MEDWWCGGCWKGKLELGLVEKLTVEGVKSRVTFIFLGSNRYIFQNIFFKFHIWIKLLPVAYPFSLTKQYVNILYCVQVFCKSQLISEMLPK